MWSSVIVELSWSLAIVLGLPYTLVSEKDVDQ